MNSSETGSNSEAVVSAEVTVEMGGKTYRFDVAEVLERMGFTSATENTLYQVAVAMAQEEEAEGV